MLQTSLNEWTTNEIHTFATLAVGPVVAGELLHADQVELGNKGLDKKSSRTEYQRVRMFVLTAVRA